MKTATAWRTGSVSDRGLQRAINEDRVFVDETRGLFLVVDGLGGHAAGETAAQTAVDIIRTRLQESQAVDENTVRSAIAEANNKIYELAETNRAWYGMACVLTLAVAQGDGFLIGHVGDSRLYQIAAGKLRKVTCDHSPVGELEDAGDLSEAEAMTHPRRNEVFRDVGATPRQAADPQFIEIKRIAFTPQSGLLLCSDGLTDLVDSAAIQRVIETYDGDANRIAQLLVEAANTAGGRDNITVIFVAGPEFPRAPLAPSDELRTRHATTRLRGERRGWSGLTRNLVLLTLGMLIGFFFWQGYQRNRNAVQETPPQPAPHTPREIRVNAADSLGISKALATALPGDTISVPPGEFLGPIRLKENVTIVAQEPLKTVVRSDPASAADSGVAVIARDTKQATIKGLLIAADETHPLRIGLLISNASIQAEKIEISGAIEAGLRIEGDSRPAITDSKFLGNAGPGVMIRDQSAPHLSGNRIIDNGRVPGAPHAGIEIDSYSQPSLVRNEISDNGLPPSFPLALDEEIRAANTIDHGKPSKGKTPPVTAPKPLTKPRTPAHAPRATTEA